MEFSKLVYIISGIGLYFFPYLIGYKKRNAISILVLNLLLGWTVIGWIVALIWAFTKDKEGVLTNSNSFKNNTSEELIKLKKLYDDGVITEEEFKKEKNRVLQ